MPFFATFWCIFVVLPPLHWGQTAMVSRYHQRECVSQLSQQPTVAQQFWSCMVRKCCFVVFSDEVLEILLSTWTVQVQIVSNSITQAAPAQAQRQQKKDLEKKTCAWTAFLEGNGIWTRNCSKLQRESEESEQTNFWTLFSAHLDASVAFDSNGKLVCERDKAF